MTYQEAFGLPADAGRSTDAEDRHNPHDRMARSDYGTPTGRVAPEAVFIPIRRDRRIDTSKGTGPAFDKGSPWFNKSSARLDYPQAAGTTRKDDPEELPAAAKPALTEADFSALEHRVLSYLAEQRQPMNNLTHAEAERLAMLAEEAAEIGQMVGKILRFGYNSRHPMGGPTNRQLLIGELQDLLAVVTLMNHDELNGSFENVAAPVSKIARKKKYSNFQF
jgi:hypothetical protein